MEPENIIFFAFLVITVIAAVCITIFVKYQSNKTDDVVHSVDHKNMKAHDSVIDSSRHIKKDIDKVQTVLDMNSTYLQSVHKEIEDLKKRFPSFQKEVLDAIKTMEGALGTTVEKDLHYGSQAVSKASQEIRDKLTESIQKMDKLLGEANIMKDKIDAMTAPFSKQINSLNDEVSAMANEITTIKTMLFLLSQFMEIYKNIMKSAKEMIAQVNDIDFAKVIEAYKFSNEYLTEALYKKLGSVDDDYVKRASLQALQTGYVAKVVNTNIESTIKSLERSTLEKTNASPATLAALKDSLMSLLVTVREHSRYLQDLPLVQQLKASAAEIPAYKDIITALEKLERYTENIDLSKLEELDAQVAANAIDFARYGPVLKFSEKKLVAPEALCIADKCLTKNQLNALQSHAILNDVGTINTQETRPLLNAVQFPTGGTGTGTGTATSVNVANILLPAPDGEYRDFCTDCVTGSDGIVKCFSCYKSDGTLNTNPTGVAYSPLCNISVNTVDGSLYC